MRSDRRHELQTNELSTQIEKVSESVKQNATLLTAIVGGAIVVIVVGIWFVNQRANAQSDAWSRLRVNRNDNTPATELLTKFEAVAKDNVSPAITRSAWLKVGQTAMFELMQNRDPNEAPDPEARKKLQASAEEAFKSVVANPGNDFTALGRALMGLGTIAEDRGEFDKAKDYYEQVVSNGKLKTTAIAGEAQYRIDHMQEWARMIEFPQAVPPMLADPNANTGPTPGVFQPPVDIKPMTEVPPTTDVDDNTTDESASDAATTPPADGDDTADAPTADDASSDDNADG